MLFYVFNHNISNTIVISNYNVLKMNKELFMNKIHSILFITLNNLGIQIQATQTQDTVVNSGHNQPLNVDMEDL